MMKHNIIRHIISLCLIIVAVSCVREDFPRENGLAEGEKWLYIDFNAEENDLVLTKFTLDHFHENAVRNIYVFLFDEAGQKKYGKWLTDSNEDLVADKAAAASKNTDCWWVSNSSSSSSYTQGGVKIKASTGNNFKVYLLTNLNADMVRLSSDLLDHNVKTLADLEAFKVYMNVESVNRNNSIVMVGSNKDVDIPNNNSDLTSLTIPLKRLDAKIKFVFQKGTRPDANGQVISSFTPKQWRVINVPATAYAVEGATDSGVVAPATEVTSENYQKYAPMYFDTPWANFEEIKANESSFSFYMLENRQAPKNEAGNEGFKTYQDRSREVKTAGGQNSLVTVDYVNHLGKHITKEMKVFKNANDFSTYVQVTGRVDMELQNDDAGQTLGADVQYLIHLGDWSANIDNVGTDNGHGGKDYNDDYTDIGNFNTERNTFYTYTVTINSVNNIRVEVESTQDGIDGDIENQPGAIGEVVIAKESIALCDAHYVSQTMTFHASNFIKRNADGTYTSTADRLTWKVRTPFNPKGAVPEIVDGQDIATGIDYKWVRFRLNKKDAMGNYFSDMRRKYNPDSFETSTVERSPSQNKEKDGTDGLGGYHNDGSMDVIYLVKWIKQQVALYVDYLNNSATDPSYVNTSAFDSGEDTDGDGIVEPKICLTAFVNEYYYEQHPINDKVYPELWKEFVNQPDRYMHILCDSHESTDGESSATGSVITIQQKSIKSIYNTDLDYTILHSAWGLESIDEFPDKIKTYNKDGSNSISGYNDDEYNGRANSVCEWGLVNKSASQATDITATGDNVMWGKFLDVEVNNETPQMQSDYSSLRYFCMARNRDNNGNGVIEKSEIRWYLASKRQLIGLFAGQGLVDASSKLYYRTAEQQASTENNVWRQHVISSTRQDNQPCVIWGEEGISTGPLSYSSQYASGLNEFGVRCARNLGVPDDADFNVVPDDYITYDAATRTFECTHLNSAALRDYNSGELLYQDQNSPHNRLYKRFEVTSSNSTFTAVNIHAINQNITQAGSAYKAGYCPEGYRLPSQLELAVMLSYMGSMGDNVPTRTYWSFGTESKKYTTGNAGNRVQIDGNYYWDKQGGNRTAYHSNGTTITLGGGTGDLGTLSRARCVRDIRTE